MVTDKLLRHLLWATFLLIATATSQANERLLDRIAAVVNDDIVLESELKTEEVAVREKLAKVRSISLSDEEVRNQALERLIVRKLQLAEAKSLGIDVDEETLLKAVNNVASRNKLTVSQLEEALRAEGMSMAEYRNELREQITLGRLRNKEVLARIQVTDAEVDNFLTQSASHSDDRVAVHLRHILIATPESASAREIQAAKEKAQKLIEEIRGGTDFASLAVRHSAGRQALEGGDLGWLQLDQVPSLFAADAVVMAKGEVKGPYQTASGFHILLLEDYQGGQRAIVKQTHARHILIRTNEITSDDDAKTRLTQVRQRIMAGEDFATLARSHSEDKGSAINGGDLSWVSPGSLVDKFEEVMDSLTVDEISQPFQTEFGWHIVQVLERREHDSTDDARREKARATLKEQKADEALELYIRRLRNQAYVDIRPEDF